MSENFSENYAGVGGVGSGGATSGIIGSIILAPLQSETELNTNYPATDPKYKNGTLAIISNATERKVFFVENQTWKWSEKYTNDKIDTLIAQRGEKVVLTIADRDNIVADNRFEGLQVYVEDASGDATVNSGGAGYILKAGLTNNDWVKKYEAESLDLDLSAENITFDNTNTNLTNTNLQDVLGEVNDKVDLKQNKTFNTVASESEMLALTGLQIGDRVFRSDKNNAEYQLKSLPSNTLTNWLAINVSTPVFSDEIEKVVTGGTLPTVDGIYAFANQPTGGMPAGVVGDILQQVNGVWSIYKNFATAGASVFAKNNGKVYNKNVSIAGQTWVVVPEPTVYIVKADGNNTKEGGYTTLQGAVDQYTTDKANGIVELGVINLTDGRMEESVVIDTENLHIQGVGTAVRSQNQITQITLSTNAKRITLKNLLISTSTTDVPLTINSASLGSHVLEGVSFSTQGNTAMNVDSLGEFFTVRDCDFGEKIVNLADRTGLPIIVTFEGCFNGVLNIGANYIVPKTNSGFLTIGSVSNSSILLDRDAGTPIAYSLIRQYSILADIPIRAGALVVNDDVGGDLKTVKCVTDYVAPNTLPNGASIDLSKYQIETDSLKEDVANKVSSFSVTPNNTNYPTEKLVKDNLDLKQNITDNALTTTSKDIVPAINEVNDKVPLGTANTIAKYSSDGTKLLSATNFVENGGNIGIGTTAPNASAILDVTSTTKGFLPPRVTTTQRNAIASPATGLVVYDTDIKSLYAYDGTSWNPTAGSLTAFVQDGNSFGSTATLGTNDNFALNLETNNATRMTITNTGNVGIGTTSPNVSSILDLTSTTRGFLPPRVTTTQRDAISSPATGLAIFNTTTGKLNVYNGAVWLEILDNASPTSSGTPTGSIVAFYSNTIPNGWLLLNGTTFNATIYPELNTFLGGNTLPDFRGLFLKGAGVTTANGMVNGTNYNAVNLGQFQDDAFKEHKHDLQDRWSSIVGITLRDGAGSYGQTISRASSSAGAPRALTVNNTGDLETRPKNIGVNYIIKT